MTNKTTKKKTAKKMGRPTVVTKKIQEDIFVWIADGKSLRSFCEKPGNPNKTTVLRHLAKNDDFCTQYAKAREFQADSHVDEMIDIADTECQVPVLIEGKPLLIDGKPLMTVTPAGVSHAKLRIETRRWNAEKMKPKKYGSKKEISVDLPEGAGVLRTPPIMSLDDWKRLSDEANEKLVEKEKEFNANA